MLENKQLTAAIAFPPHVNVMTCACECILMCLTVSAEVIESPGLLLDCVDHPELANCKLIVYARLCSSQYYSSFCCASCARYATDKEKPGQAR